MTSVGESDTVLPCSESQKKQVSAVSLGRVTAWHTWQQRRAGQTSWAAPSRPQGSAGEAWVRQVQCEEGLEAPEEVPVMETKKQRLGNGPVDCGL